MAAALRVPAAGLVWIRGVLAEIQDDHTAMRIVSVLLSGLPKAMHLGEVLLVGIVQKTMRIAVLEPRLRVPEAAKVATSLHRGPLAER